MFENRLLLERACATLRAPGYATIWSADVPVGKGGLAVGQLAWAAVR